MKRKIYLNMKTLPEARALLLSHFSPGGLVGEEEVAARDACGRVTSRPVAARLSSPGFHSAAMDGYAVRAEETFPARDESPVTLRLRQQAVPVNTGMVLPEGKDAVVMVEHVVETEGGEGILLRSPVFPWQNVRKVGEDIVATEQVFPSNHLLAPFDLGALISSGNSRVWVWKRPLVDIIPTGNELVDLDQVGVEEIAPGMTPESNSAVLAAIVSAAGAEPRVHAIVPDERDVIKKRIRQAVEGKAHVVLVNAGSSAGSADYTVQVLEELGRVLVHGVTIMPGKPTILAVVSGKPVIGIPGYPVSAIIAAEQLVVPLLCRLQARPEPFPIRVRAFLAANLPSRAGIEEFRRVIAGRVGDRIVASPVKKGAGSISTLTRANAIMRIPLESEGFEEGRIVELELLRPWQELEKTLVCIGSHDLSLDLIADRLKRASPGFQMASTHVGSLGGLVAVSKGLCHMAGTHLLDPEDGSYNISYIKRFVKGRGVRLINLVYRQQGFMVAPGNPRGISGIKDLAREDIVFVNRQAGSGTRVLLDYELEKAGLDPDEINGYENEEYTHMAVAVSVLSGKADAGLGILSAARALGLDFIPVCEERYDLLIPLDCLENQVVKRVLDCIKSGDFRKDIEALGGYSTRDAGKVFYDSREDSGQFR